MLQPRWLATAVLTCYSQADGVCVCAPHSVEAVPGAAGVRLQLLQPLTLLPLCHVRRGRGSGATGATAVRPAAIQVGGSEVRHCAGWYGGGQEKELQGRLCSTGGLRDA